MELRNMLGELLENRRIVHKLDVRRVLVDSVCCRCAMTWVMVQDVPHDVLGEVIEFTIKNKEEVSVSDVYMTVAALLLAAYINTVGTLTWLMCYLCHPTDPSFRYARHNVFRQASMSRFCATLMVCN